MSIEDDIKWLDEQMEPREEHRIEIAMTGEKHPLGCQRTVGGFWLIDPECPLLHPDEKETGPVS